MKRHFANMVFALILIAYTVYAALDTFVIVRVLTPDTLPTATAEASTAPTEAPPAAPISTDTEYHDDQIDIVLTTMRVENTTVYVADVQLADISLLKTALAGNTYARNLTETTSVQAANAGAILAINGDYYGAQERGYVLRNGVLDTNGLLRKIADEDAAAAARSAREIELLKTIYELKHTINR